MCGYKHPNACTIVECTEHAYKTVIAKQDKKDKKWWQFGAPVVQTKRVYQGEEETKEEKAVGDWTLHAMNDDWAIFYKRIDTGIRLPFGCNGWDSDLLPRALNKVEATFETKEKKGNNE
jgi:hypothetical protein